MRSKANRPLRKLASRAHYDRGYSKPIQQGQPSSASRWSSPRVVNLLLSLVLAFGVIAIYYPVHWQPFANYDDPDYVTDNIHVKAGLHWET